MRGTIPASRSRGIHLLAAFLPDEGWVMFQVKVGSKEKVMEEVVYDVTSLTAQEADPDRLLALIRKHCQMENGLHYRWP